ncbi:hypothetical protein FNF29_05143 [Cafeteria roenbergensis]|uniref:PCI domain-containing protein n=1 Tax=Cafeteria roenbergensis TaxID=33653 RepID=A0A5A8CCG6_CAFRO|nr:hypothetical protein FNF29_05143 [Cafeteria roenbergensis]|eukprot:KAA0150568.1 hypothetical protein FNF29_05143 [Cafeteria roenbergensis]
MALDKAVALLDSATAATGVRMAVEQTLNDRHVFFVGSLLDHKAISLLDGSEYAGWLKALRLFAHGTYSEFKADRSSYPELSARAAWKLKQLSLMTTAAKNARPAYDDLQRDLDLASPAEVERLAISCIDAGLLDAKLNQRESVVEVRSVRGRDLAVEDIPASLAKLDMWQAAIKASIARLEAEAGRASASYAAGQEMASSVETVLGQAVVSAAAAEPEAGKGRRGASGGFMDGAGLLRGVMGGVFGRMGGPARRDPRRR